jgi:Pherophorin
MNVDHPWATGSLLISSIMDLKIAIRISDGSGQFCSINPSKRSVCVTFGLYACMCVRRASASAAAVFPYCPCQRSASKSGLYVAPQVEVTEKGEYCFTVKNDGKAKTGKCANQNMYKFELDASE